MKKNLKAILTVFCAAVLALNLIPAKASAEALPDSTAWLMYTDGNWAGTADPSNPVVEGWTLTNATITGAGEYSVGIDFTGTADGMAKGLNFSALGITGGEVNFPGYFIEINSIVVNGEEIEIQKGYTSSDDKVVTRMNIYNSWVGTIPEDAHSVDGDISDVAAVIVDPAAFAEVKTMTVDFTYYDAAGNSGAAEEAPAEEAPAATADVPKTGVVGLGLVYGLGALATGAVVLKRKEK